MPWVKTLPPGIIAASEAREEALLARTEATTKGAKITLDALERTARAEVERPGPVWLPPARSTLAAALLATGKTKEALTEYERVLDAHTRHAPALLGAARARGRPRTAPRQRRTSRY